MTQEDSFDFIIGTLGLQDDARVVVGLLTGESHAGVVIGTTSVNGLPAWIYLDDGAGLERVAISMAAVATVRRTP